MAITDNYAMIGASGDNFDCDSTSGWVKGGNAEDPTTQSNRVEGDNSIGLTTSDTGYSWLYHDISAGNRFKITELDVGMWFYYIKGKGSAFLSNNNTAVAIRLYFGGTDKWADYYTTEHGNRSLAFGWQLMMVSGSERNGGDVGGGHNGGSDFDLDVHRLEFRLNVDKKIDVPLGIDCFFVGNTITVTDGDEGSPIDVSTLEDYTFNSRPGFPIGTVKVTGNLINMKSGLTIDGGGFAAENKYVLFNQMSPEVKHELNVVNGGYCRFGVKNTIDGRGLAVKGCYVVKPSNGRANMYVDGTSKLVGVNSKFLQWSIVKLSGTIEMLTVDVSNCEEFVLDGSTCDIDGIKVHDNTNLYSNCAVRIMSEPGGTVKNMMIYNVVDGIYADDDVMFDTLEVYDESGKSIKMLNGVNVQVVNSIIGDIEQV